MREYSMSNELFSQTLEACQQEITAARAEGRAECELRVDCPRNGVLWRRLRDLGYHLKYTECPVSGETILIVKL